MSVCDDGEIKVEILDQDDEDFYAQEPKIPKKRNRRKQTTPTKFNHQPEPTPVTPLKIAVQKENEDDDFFVGIAPPPPEKKRSYKDAFKPANKTRNGLTVTKIESLAPKPIQPRKIESRDSNDNVKSSTPFLDPLSLTPFLDPKAHPGMTILTPTNLPNGQVIYQAVQTPLRNTLFRCDKCCFVFTNQANCIVHKKEVHNCWRCPKCKLEIFGPKQFTHTKNTASKKSILHTYMERHLDNHRVMDMTNAPLYCCAVCHKSFIKKETLSMHMKDVHSK